MKPLSQQIRELVQASSTSAYAIAKEASIDKSTMSRFMNGGSLTMDKLDSLARILGANVTVSVSQIPRNLRKGRPKKTVTKPDERLQKLDQVANDLAQEAHESHFESRRGVWSIRDGNLEGHLFYFNNNPYQRDPSLRKRETERIRRRLASELQAKVVAKGSAGQPIADGGEAYTIGFILKCDPKLSPEVLRIVEEEAERTIGL